MIPKTGNLFRFSLLTGHVTWCMLSDRLHYKKIQEQNSRNSCKRCGRKYPL